MGEHFNICVIARVNFGIEDQDQKSSKKEKLCFDGAIINCQIIDLENITWSKTKEHIS